MAAFELAVAGMATTTALNLPTPENPKFGWLADELHAAIPFTRLAIAQLVAASDPSEEDLRRWRRRSDDMYSELVRKLADLERSHWSTGASRALIDDVVRDSDRREPPSRAAVEASVRELAAGRSNPTGITRVASYVAACAYIRICIFEFGVWGDRLTDRLVAEHGPDGFNAT